VSTATVQIAVQVLALIGLFAYCYETYKIRKASQAQVEASQKLLQSSLNQIEGMSKPCITIWTQLRDDQDVILEVDGAVGSLIARPNEGSYVIHNIGNGAALNLRYSITRGDPAVDVPGRRTKRYMPAILAAAKVSLVETLALHDKNHEAIFEYESVGGRTYCSTITLSNHVITSFRFEEII
jgi:hypothetical protein